MTARKGRVDRAMDRLCRAVSNYVEANGGVVAVTHEIQIQEWPSDGPLQFTVAVKCSGRKPVFAAKDAEREGGAK